jgi:pyruvate-formate lyase-activating enzyme
VLIGGFQKMNMLDFPGNVACTIFTYGCNFRCPFCHNATLVIDEEQLFSEEEIRPICWNLILESYVFGEKQIVKIDQFLV